MPRFLVLLTASLCAGVTALATPRPPLAPLDSIGVQYQGNRVLIKHRVVAGETLYGISRRYKVPVDQIVAANPQLRGAVISGQVVLVPRTRVVVSGPAAARPAAGKAVAPVVKPALAGLRTDARGNRIYVVERGQTLFSTARRFNMTPQELARLNGVPPTYGVRIGQTLIIVPAGRVPASARPVLAAPAAPAVVAPKVVVPPASSPAALPERADAADREKETRPEADAAPTTPATPAVPAPTEERVPERASEIVHRVRENGLAASIEGAMTDKYLALHKTAPVGTIMQVRNIMNNQTVYVRVIGQLPDTGENSNILVRLSLRAVQRLATPNSRFRVETSYVP